MFALYLALPFELGSAANVDKRMPIAIALVALASLDVHIRREAASFWLTGLVVAALLVKQGALAVLWRSFDPVIDAAVASLEALPAGSEYKLDVRLKGARYGNRSEVPRKLERSITRYRALIS